MELIMEKLRMAAELSLYTGMRVGELQLCISSTKNDKIRVNPLTDDIPSLTVGKIKNGYKPSKHGLCSRFSFRNDMCYIMILLI